MYAKRPFTVQLAIESACFSFAWPMRSAACNWDVDVTREWALNPAYFFGDEGLE